MVARNWKFGWSGCMALMDRETYRQGGACGGPMIQFGDCIRDSSTHGTKIAINLFSPLFRNHYAALHARAHPRACVHMPLPRLAGTIAELMKRICAIDVLSRRRKLEPLL